MHRTLLLIAAFALTAATLHAQQPSPPVLSAPHDDVLWPQIFSGTRIDIVLLSDPKTRHPCKVEFTPDDTIRCSGKHRQPAVTYALVDIAAVIEPPVHAFRRDMIIGILVGSATLATSFFVPITAISVLLRVISGIGFLTADLSSGSIPYVDHNFDVVRFQRPGTTLQVALNYAR